MLKRRGVDDPRVLQSEAYEIFLTMLNSYDVNRSKVPFANYLKFFIKSGKNYATIALEQI